MRPLFSLSILMTMTISACSNPQSSLTVAVESAAPVAHATQHGSDHATAVHGDHTPHHGGIVYMKGDLHFEVVLSGSGTHRIYFSDAARAELPAATASEVTLTISDGSGAEQTLRAEVDETGESWVAKGRSPSGADTTVRIAFVVGNEPYWIDVPYVEVVGGS